MEFSRTKISRVYTTTQDWNGRSELIVAFSDGRMAMLNDKWLIYGITCGMTEIIPEILEKTYDNGETRKYLNRVYIETNGVIEQYFSPERPQDIMVRPLIEADGSLTLEISKKHAQVIEDLAQMLCNWRSEYSMRAQDTMCCKIKDYTGKTVATSFESFCHIGMDGTNEIRERLLVTTAAVDLGIVARVYRKFIGIKDPLAVTVKHNNGFVACKTEYVVDKITFDSNFKLFSITIRNILSGQVVFSESNLTPIAP